MKLNILFTISIAVSVTNAFADSTLDRIIETHEAGCEHDPDCLPSPFPEIQAAFDSTSCTTPALTNEKAANFFRLGEFRVEVGKAHYQARVRKCTKLTGCSGWAVVSTLDLIYAAGGQFTPMSADAKVTLHKGSDGILMQLYGANPAGDGEDTFSLTTRELYIPISGPPQGYTLMLLSDDYMYGHLLKLRLPNGGFTKKFNESLGATVSVAEVREGCARFVFDIVHSLSTNAEQWLEYQLGAIARY